ncbi:hypothetical protein ACWN8V_00155 [Vagococcus elongatus]|uniref:Uncharacterized protein n=1 Tax=Vagococcus elongatus TaxID=180344 RepID=A0A430B588_9ENTE|nr:hypothetical protein [Vagococcus elongatus]RSU15526.1 hypothetical protein CBF29_00150 [Vagococcus elongatus]
MKIEWSKYLKEDPNFSALTENQEYINVWEIFLQQHQQELNKQKEELILVGGNLTIEAPHMILEYLLINNKSNTIKDVEIGVTLFIRGEKYFKGKLITPKERYADFEPNTARLDLIDFGSQNLEDAILTPEDYELKIDYCKEKQSE